MAGKNSVIAIIPARGGSKRLPRKNVLDLAGKPLIAWTIEAALDSGIFDRIIVNTDDQEIADVAIKYGAEVPFLRPAQLATDKASTIDVLKHQLEYHHTHGDNYQHLVVLQPTSPLRTSRDITEAWQRYNEAGAVSLVSVTPVEHPIQWTFEASEDMALTPMFDDELKQSQAYKLQFRLNGAIYITSTAHLSLKSTLVSSTCCIGYQMTAKKSVDVDTDYHFWLCEQSIRDGLTCVRK
ncbi:acylneuraminate cytidylyltransferase family protein [Photobacterium sanguinicancri]|uniref:acylneuraminate cytidylyltransferase family protein n=1 Tax=Photobacterium sanguinicancri TaxID=875932 RepID=UPI0021C40D16|nr:acylneuraminate cytidylyltransferase family protein [Photobacterium sanguinicancri]